MRREGTRRLQERWGCPAVVVLVLVLVLVLLLLLLVVVVVVVVVVGGGAFGAFGAFGASRLVGPKRWTWGTNHNPLVGEDYHGLPRGPCNPGSM